MKSTLPFSIRLFSLSAAMLFTNALLVTPSLSAAEEEPKADGSSVESLFEAREFTGEKGSVLKYRLLKPMEYDEGKKYPVVLFLHGAGERGDDNLKQLVHGAKDFANSERRKEFPAFVIAPQCPAGKRWSEVDWNLVSSTLPQQPSDSMSLVKALLDEMIQSDRVDSQRVYITGLSMGGFGTWDAIARYPGFFAAAIPICGGGDPATAPRMKNTPVWCFHGDQDFVVRVERSREMVDALKESGGQVEYTEYPGVGHDSWTATYANPEIYPWLFSKKQTPSTP